MAKSKVLSSPLCTTMRVLGLATLCVTSWGLTSPGFSSPHDDRQLKNDNDVDLRESLVSVTPHTQTETVDRVEEPST